MRYQCLVCGSNPKVCIQMTAIDQYCCPVYYAVQGGSNFWICGWNPKVWPFKCKLFGSTFLCCCLLCCTTVVLTFESVNEILKCDHLMKATEQHSPVVLFDCQPFAKWNLGLVSVQFWVYLRGKVQIASSKVWIPCGSSNWSTATKSVVSCCSVLLFKSCFCFSAMSSIR